MLKKCRARNVVASKQPRARSPCIQHTHTHTYRSPHFVDRTHASLLSFFFFLAMLAICVYCFVSPSFFFLPSSMKYYFRSTICEILSQNKKKKKKGKGIGGENSEDGSNPLPSGFAHFASSATVSKKRTASACSVCVCVCVFDWHACLFIAAFSFFFFFGERKDARHDERLPAKRR